MGSIKDIKAMADLWLWLDKVGLTAPGSDHSTQAIHLTFGRIHRRERKLNT